MAVPPRVVTVMRPLVAPAGTWPLIWWSESTLAPGSGTPLNLTWVTSVKPEPAIVTSVPAGPVAGVTEVIRGRTRNMPLLWPAPEGVTTVSLPVEASGGTSTVIWVWVTVAGSARTPLKSTPVAPPKALPLIVTLAPTSAEPGEKPATRGVTSRVAALVAVPPGVVTVICPSLAVAGTISRNWVRERTLKPALTPCTLTALTPPKPVPSTTTGLPGAWPAGAKPEIVGTARKPLALTAVPPAVVTVMRPLVALAGTWAVIWWSESTLALPSGTPLNLTAVTSVKPEPAIVTVAPAGALPGLTEVIRGSTRKVPLLWPAPAEVTTVSFPVEAAAGTSTVIWVGVTVAGRARTPLKRTPVAPPKAFPLIVTLAPTGAEPGAKPTTRGVTIKIKALSAVPPGVVTVMKPLVAAAGTIRRSWV